MRFAPQTSLPPAPPRLAQPEAGPPRVSPVPRLSRGTSPRTEQVRLRSESRGTAGWLPGGTAISRISLRRLAHDAG